MLDPNSVTFNNASPLDKIFCDNRGISKLVFLQMGLTREEAAGEVNESSLTHGRSDSPARFYLFQFFPGFSHTLQCASREKSLTLTSTSTSNFQIFLDLAFKNLQY